jgi:hypothetical protein
VHRRRPTARNPPSLRWNLLIFSTRYPLVNFGIKSYKFNVFNRLIESIVSLNQDRQTHETGMAKHRPVIEDNAGHRFRERHEQPDIQQGISGAVISYHLGLSTEATTGRDRCGRFWVQPCKGVAGEQPVSQRSVTTVPGACRSDMPRSA